MSIEPRQVTREECHGSQTTLLQLEFKRSQQNQIIPDCFRTFDLNSRQAMSGHSLSFGGVLFVLAHAMDWFDSFSELG